MTPMTWKTYQLLLHVNRVIARCLSSLARVDSFLVSPWSRQNPCYREWWRVCLRLRSDDSTEHYLSHAYEPVNVDEGIDVILPISAVSTAAGRSVITWLRRTASRHLLDSHSTFINTIHSHQNSRHLRQEPYTIATLDAQLTSLDTVHCTQ